MRCIAVRASQLKKCPNKVMLPGHFRDDGTCLCDGKPGFGMGLLPIRIFSGGWVDLNSWLTDNDKSNRGSRAASIIYHELFAKRWPKTVADQVALARRFSIEHPKMLVGVFGENDEHPQVMYFQGLRVRTGPWVPAPKKPGES